MTQKWLVGILQGHDYSHLRTFKYKLGKPRARRSLRIHQWNITIFPGIEPARWWLHVQGINSCPRTWNLGDREGIEDTRRRLFQLIHLARDRDPELREQRVISNPWWSYWYTRWNYIRKFGQMVCLEARGCWVQKWVRVVHIVVRTRIFSSEVAAPGELETRL